MAIPEKPLEIASDIQTMTLDELTLFSEKGFNFFDFREFLYKYGSWTKEEVGALTLKDMIAVAEQIGEAIKKQAVPLAS